MLCVSFQQIASSLRPARRNIARSDQSSAKCEQHLPLLRVHAFEARVQEVGSVAPDPTADIREISRPFSRVCFFKHGTPMMYAEALALLASDGADGKNFRLLHAQVLACQGTFWECVAHEYFWEMRPVCKESLKKTAYEFVLIDAHEIGNKDADCNAFHELHSHMASTDVVEFTKASPTSGETTFLAPAKAPESGLDDYRSVGRFFQTASFQQRGLFLRKLGSHMRKRMEERPDPSFPLCVSSTGDDVAWAHLRFDDAPQHYSFRDYRVMYASSAPTLLVAPVASGQVDTKVKALQVDDACQRLRLYAQAC